MDTVTTRDKRHGRRERRTLKATTALNEYLDWPGVAQVGTDQGFGVSLEHEDVDTGGGRARC